MLQRMVSGFNRPRNPADRIPGSARLTSLHRAGLFQAGKLALVCISVCAGCAGRGDVEIGFGFAFCSSFRNLELSQGMEPGAQGQMHSYRAGLVASREIGFGL